MFADQRPYAAGKCVPHIRSVDLDRHLIGADQAIGRALLGHKPGFLVNDGDLDAGGTHVHAQEIDLFHGDPSLN